MNYARIELRGYNLYALSVRKIEYCKMQMQMKRQEGRRKEKNSGKNMYNYLNFKDKIKIEIGSFDELIRIKFKMQKFFKDY